MRAIAVALIVTFTSTAFAQDRRGDETARWPASIPALSARVSDSGDGRAWFFRTSIDTRTVSVIANANGASLAVTLQRARHGHPTCASLLVDALHTTSIETLRAPQPEAFRAAPFFREVYRQRIRDREIEYGCVRINGEVWLATALAQATSDGSVALVDTAPMARRLVFALATARIPRGYPALLDISRLELDDPSDESTWLYTGRADGFPLASDAISSGAGRPGGVTLTVGRFRGTCGAAWRAIRPAFTNEGTMVDRPGYVPAAFGSRIRRISLGDRLREVYCVATARGATVITAVFRADDGDAMSRAAPMLRTLVTAAARDAIEPAPPR